LENCIVCDNAVIEQNCVLKNCIVGHRVVVAENTEKEKSHIDANGGLMEIE
jgi:ADP-glucose pyrophosphorylase